MTLTVAEIMALDVHPVALAFPEIVGDDLEAMKASIHADGMRESLKLWKDTDGKVWIADGRTRRNIYKELLGEGNVDPDKDAVPYDFLGDISEAEMIGMVSRIQLNRREISKSQKAFLAVALTNMEYKARGEKPGRSKTGEGEFNDKVAARFGVSRSYVADARSVAKYPDLFKKGIAGQNSVNELLSLKNIRDAKPARGSAKDMPGTNGASGAPAGQEASGGTPAASTGQGNGHIETPGAAPGEKPLEIHDGLDNVIEDAAYKKVFVVRDEVKQLASAMNNLNRRVEDLCMSSGGIWFDRQSLLAAVKTVKSGLTKQQPHAICPECLGEGMIAKEGNKKRQRCPCCGGNAYVTKAQYDTYQKAKGVAQTSAETPENEEAESPALAGTAAE